jgi:predicted RNA-binding Zn ribbon-like protein
MTGENTIDAPQPGGRRPAPGELALVQAFVNTHYDLATADGGDVLAAPEALAAWLAQHGLADSAPALDGEDLRRALAVREGLRALAFANNGEPLDAAAVGALNAAAATARAGVRLGADGPAFVAAAAPPLDAALGVLLAHTARAMIDGRWRRLKACPGRHCGWAFYDASRNLSARWCSMQVCGGREKARAYYRRHAA